MFSHPELERPVLLAAFRGWNDGAQAASLAAGYLAKTWGAEQFADIDPEDFFDFQATRPHVSLEEGLTRRIDWPETGFYHARPEGLDRDIVLLLGIEPNLHWRTFTDLVVMDDDGAVATTKAPSARTPTGKSIDRAPSPWCSPCVCAVTSSLGSPWKTRK